jgi:hypothetical protein
VTVHKARSTRGQVTAGLFAVLALAVTAASTAHSAAPTGLVHARLASAAAADASTNWAGYAVRSTDPGAPINFTSVTGTWTQTAATCGSGDASAASAIWVGLGGYDLKSQALEQIGTDADCTRSGSPRYYAWYELVPSPPVNLTLKINPGDLITTSVNITGNSVLLQLKNRTRGTVFTKRATFNSPDVSSAEWIAEAPSSCSDSSCSPLPLANFGSVSFSRIATIGNGHPGTLTDSTWTAVPLQLVPGLHGGFGFFPGPDRGFVRNGSTAGTALPAGLSADGRSFVLSWVSNASATSGQ